MTMGVEMESPITRAELEEFRRGMASEHERLEAEDRRQNKRLDALEKSTEQISELTASVREMAANIKSMTDELTRQGRQMEQQAQQTGERLTKLEGRDGEKYRQIGGYIVASVISVIVGAILGVVFMKLGLT